MNKSAYSTGSAFLDDSEWHDGLRDELFAQFMASTRDDPDHPRLREACIRAYQPLAVGLAQRFVGRGEPLDDLVQVANLGLLGALDRFDPARGARFETYAVPTIIGEIKRHFRDRGWSIRVSRRLQELKLALNKAREELSQALDRPPTVAELAAHLGIEEREVLEGLEASQAYQAWSLDTPVTGDDDRAVREPAECDGALDLVEDREALTPLLADLPERERQILLMRFFGNMTQEQIAQRVGVSQMHVSRLLAHTLSQLKEKLLDAC